MSDETKQKGSVGDFLIMGIITLLVGSAVYTSMFEKSELVDLPAPAFTAVTASGAHLGMEEQRGKTVLIDFWATWCPPCRKQMPVIARLEGEMGDKLSVVSVNVDDPGPQREQMVQRYLRNSNLEFDVVYDDGPLMGLYKVRKFPTLIIVDPSGVVTYADSGYLKYDKLNSLLADAGSSQ